MRWLDVLLRRQRPDDERAVKRRRLDTLERAVINETERARVELEEHRRARLRAAIDDAARSWQGRS